jgi:hypothetical protein
MPQLTQAAEILILGLTGFPDAVEQNISGLFFGSGEPYCAQEIFIINH